MSYQFSSWHTVHPLLGDFYPHFKQALNCKNCPVCILASNSDSRRWGAGHSLSKWSRGAGVRKTYDAGPQCTRLCSAASKSVPEFHSSPGWLKPGLWWGTFPVFRGALPGDWSTTMPSQCRALDFGCSSDPGAGAYQVLKNERTK